MGHALIMGHVLPEKSHLLLHLCNMFSNREHVLSHVLSHIFIP
jgi:hypothetical protein